MFRLRNTITLFVLTLGLCFFATQAQATPISFTKLQQMPTQQNQLLESSSMTQHYLNATQNFGQDRDDSRQNSSTLGTKHQEMIGPNLTKQPWKSINWVYMHPYTSVAAAALITFTLTELFIATNLIFSKDQYYWSRIGMRFFFIGSLLWGAGLVLSPILAMTNNSTIFLTGLGISSFFFAVNVAGYKNSKQIYKKARTQIKVAPWLKPSSDGSNVSGGLSLFGSF